MTAAITQVSEIRFIGARKRTQKYRSSTGPNFNLHVETHSRDMCKAWRECQYMKFSLFYSDSRKHTSIELEYTYNLIYYFSFPGVRPIG